MRMKFVNQASALEDRMRKEAQARTFYTVVLQVFQACLVSTDNNNN